MKNINIPEPCSEDWNEMTPTEKGAFCQKCALDVYDFTNKTGDEIRDILTLNIGSPVCMRIQPEQIEELNDDFVAWKMTNKRSFNRAWVFTLFVVFGMTLFSCEEDEEPVVEKFQQIGQSFLAKINTVNPIEDQNKADIENKESIAESKTSNAKSSECTQQVNLFDEIELPMTGEAYYEPYEEVRLEEVVVLRDRPDIREVHATAGVPMISPEYNTYLREKITPQEQEDLEEASSQEISGLTYPNPAANHTTLQITVPKTGKGEIQLVGLNGKRIRTIHSGRIKKGVSEYPVDLSNLEAGLYMFVVQSGQLKQSIKFSKI